MKKYLVILSFLQLHNFVVAQVNDSSQKISSHFQLTGISQGHTSFPVLDQGGNTLMHEAESNKLSLTSTLFLGKQLWKNAAVYYNPEISGGQGLSQARGVAGFTNGETFRIGSAEPVLYNARFFLQQHFNFDHQHMTTFEDGANQVRQKISDNRLTLTLGKISLADYFDKNSFSHDTRSQFMNWSLMSNGAWDYPADTRGYTKGIVAEWFYYRWAFRGAATLVPLKANGLQLDDNISKAHGVTFETERNWMIHKLPGTARVLLFANTSQAPTYNEAIANAQKGDSTASLVVGGLYAWNKYSNTKYGYGINVEQYVHPNIGVFLKTSWNDGKSATWAFTEIDQSTSFGAHFKGTIWNRAKDNIGIGYVENGISKEHQNYLKAGLNGFIIGDGKLNYGKESIIEIYYKARLLDHIYGSFDYQWVRNPAYNKDNQGPVLVFAFRLHVEF